MSKTTYPAPPAAANALAHLSITTREFERATAQLKDPELIHKFRAGNVLLKNMKAELESFFA